MALARPCTSRHGRSSFRPLTPLLYAFPASLYSIRPNDPAQIEPINHLTGSSAMAVSQAIPITRHPFANGSYKQMLIDGKWVDAASGKRFETHNPATGELLATVAEGDKEDIDRAVAAARRCLRRALEQGQAVRAAEPAAQARRPRREEFRRIVAARHARHGRAAQPHPRLSPARRRHAALLRRPDHRDPRRDHRELAARRNLLLHAEGADRRRRRHHSLERPADRDDLEDRSGASRPAAPSC